MRKIVLGALFLLVFSLSSCSKYDNFEYDTNRIQNLSGLEAIINDMMEKGEHTDDTEIQYDLVSGVFTYNGGNLYVDSILYNVYAGTKNGTHEFDNFQCRSASDGKLSCTESELSQEVTELKATITLGEIKELLSKVDIADLTDNLKNKFSVFQYQNTIISFVFENYSNDDVTLGEGEEFTNVYLSDNIIVTGTQQFDGIVMIMKIVFTSDSGATIFQVFVD